MSDRNNRMSKWYKRSEIDDLLDVAVPGDLLEFHRNLYVHWAVYVGYREVDGKMEACVIHRCSTENSGDGIGNVFASTSLRKREVGLGEVEQQTLTSVWEDSICRINNTRDDELPPYAANMVLQRADDARKMEHTEEYNVITNNCEHFANWCRYGTKESGQVDRATFYIVAGAVLVGVASTIGALFSLATNTSRSRNTSKSRRREIREEPM